MKEAVETNTYSSVEVTLKDGTISKLNPDDLLELLESSLDLEEITCSMSVTRQVKDYTPNTYFCATKFNVSRMYSALQTPKKDVEVYLATAVRNKVGKCFSFLKSQICSQIERDGLKSMGLNP
jgi:hypothetical protein